MDLILAIFHAFGAARDVLEVSDWVLGQVKRWSAISSTETIEKEVEQIAAASESDIRGAAAKAFTKVSKPTASEEKREELIGVLINLTRQRALSKCVSAR